MTETNKQFAVLIDADKASGVIELVRVEEAPSENPTPTRTWSELIRCPECKTVEWAMVEQEHEMPFPFYKHDCQRCGHMILESEWDPLGAVRVPDLVRAALDEGGTAVAVRVGDEVDKAQARIKELEIDNAVLSTQLADQRAYNERAPKIAAEEANRQTAELRARIKELESRPGIAVKALEARLSDAKRAAEKFIVLVDLCDLHGPAIQCREASNELAKTIGFTLEERVARQSELIDSKNK